MANQEHLNLLKQGVEVWNRWRSEYSDTLPDLSRADLKGYYLRNADFSHADLSGADLSGTISSGAQFIKANLNGALLNRGYFYGADFSDANLGGAELGAASLIIVNLRNSNLSGANLSVADLSGADLSGTDLSGAILDHTKFSWNDLRFIRGLDSIEYRGPCSVDVKSVHLPQGKALQSFLRSVGFSNQFIDYLPSLLTDKAIEYSSCFISYSSKNQNFAERLYADLQNRGVRCWFAPEDLKIGAKIRSSIDEFIRLHDKVLLVLSQHSVASQWVEQEVETALAKEYKENRIVLFPIRLDNTVMDMEGGWPALIRNTRNVGNFTHWKRRDAYQKAFERLLRDLKTKP